MTITTAKVTAVKQAIACTPSIQGKLLNATIVAAHFAGADEIFVLRGTQAIAAMAIGTETIKRVDFITGPGNAFMAEAKRLLFEEIGIDLFAGRLKFSSPDMLAVLIMTSEKVRREAINIVDKLLENLPTAELAGTSWRDYGKVILVDNINKAYKLADKFSSEHVQILTQNPREALEMMSNYGNLFLGEKTCVSYGDRYIGTNDVLPTRKAGNYTGSLWVGKFLKTQTNLPLVHHEIIENGDVILVIGQDSIKIQLSSSFLCLVSPVFKAMLTSPMIEGQRLKERGDRPVEYVLLNDSAEATLHAFKYLYGSDPKMLNLNPDEILQVAVFADK
ncbi:hypothetical protein CDV31_004131 [Fusarium ambrosium]|uniref:BTB domain-containing protein n=1 Tax=Fusarium ambrosium TaxID=131363 RepID=A0A428US20_9HYPO|nr:hypothetical protein CDV31_004131 [Fusarium ambrosium]